MSRAAGAVVEPDRTPQTCVCVIVTVSYREMCDWLAEYEAVEVPLPLSFPPHLNSINHLLSSPSSLPSKPGP